MIFLDILFVTSFHFFYSFHYLYSHCSILFIFFSLKLIIVLLNCSTNNKKRLGGRVQSKTKTKHKMNCHEMPSTNIINDFNHVKRKLKPERSVLKVHLWRFLLQIVVKFLNICISFCFLSSCFALKKGQMKTGESNYLLIFCCNYNCNY